MFYNFNKVVRKLAQEKQKQEIDNKEVADRLNVRLEVVEQMAQRLKTPELSIHAPLSTIHPEGSSNLIDMLADEEDICPESRLLYMDEVQHRKKTLQHALKILSEREQEIIRRRWLSESQESLQSIGDSMGLSRERIRQLEAKAMDKLRSFMQKVAA